ncbi:FAD-binding and (Fe-S)-binding domain-containing protein [Nesterenkonia sp. CL21]|uniref:FAD-binding and (Fe-S)-binding domain-containing protein n=1 Tax=Nesterenkonia sp. CL21 TaxID=3064894 RepID=UPI0028793468|nr:FAD-binding and (Fe-S)-binding domain-containing protein [Nesterenkonia sp. CL21]MDS2174191.1 FAD-binding and (Fe-S)-binding domain-containing protein [Nesterenkonia sp. CL21]
MDLRGTPELSPSARRRLLADLTGAVGRDRVLDRAIDRHSRAHDASHYLLVPLVVVIAESIEEVAAVMAVAAAHRVPVTLRSGGTSLSGQASGAGILVDTRRGFRRIEVLDDGERVRAQAGATLRAVNTRLARHGRALGPDPASEAACTIGGVIANNSSGMAAGIEHNSTRTLESLVAVLPSGTVVDTAAEDSLLHLRRHEPRLVADLERLQDRIRHDPDAVAEIRERFSLKNTMGYSLDAFCEAEGLLQLLNRLLIGSEGTLGFVADAVFRTVPVQPAAATGLLIFDSVDAAARSLPDLVGTGAKALELMDAESLRVARRLPQAPSAVDGFEVRDHAAILVEYRGDDPAELDGVLGTAAPVISALPTVRPAELSRDPAARAALWSVRKGLYAAVAEARPPGTTALLEDVVVPVERLAAACRELAGLLAEHGYTDPVIFGHAKDGNLHFMITEDTEDPADLARLEAFTEDLVRLILRHGGNLKAEHGTGRAMAPFIDRQYSAALVEVLHGVKRAFDPAGVLNPGVVLTADTRAHLQDLKPVDRVDDEVDRCVECGYCEPVCPSRDLTLTPRQRIVVRRARARAEADGDLALVAALDEQQQYESIDTCAADGLCASACPVGIDTGALVKRLRGERRGRLSADLWRAAARHWDTATAAAGRTLDAAAHVPPGLITAPNRAARALIGPDTVPLWSTDLPSGGRLRSLLTPPADDGEADGGARGTGEGDAAVGQAAAIFLPSCQGAMFAPAGSAGTEGSGVQQAVSGLCAAAGLRLLVPEEIDTLCCGTPWSSKGFTAGQDVMAERVLTAVAALQRPEAGTIGHPPVIVDATSCTEGVQTIMTDARARQDPRAVSVVDAVSFVVEHVLPRLTVDPRRRVESLTLHPTCSSQKAGVSADLQTLAEAVAVEVHVPADWGCCGFAGDRGMLHPELTASATAAEAREVRQLDAVDHASCNRACEIAMTRATGRVYRHLLEVAADVLVV